MTFLDILVIIAALFNILLGIATIIAARREYGVGAGCVAYVSLTLGVAMLIAVAASLI